MLPGHRMSSGGGRRWLGVLKLGNHTPWWRLLPDPPRASLWNLATQGPWTLPPQVKGVHIVVVSLESWSDWKAKPVDPFPEASLPTCHRCKSFKRSLLHLPLRTLTPTRRSWRLPWSSASIACTAFPARRARPDTWRNTRLSRWACCTRPLGSAGGGGWGSQEEESSLEDTRFVTHSPIKMVW